jgi:hypothetical protein
MPELISRGSVAAAAPNIKSRRVAIQGLLASALLSSGKTNGERLDTVAHIEKHGVILRWISSRNKITA